jgi:uncharacterized HhH-GPD family protein
MAMKLRRQRQIRSARANRRLSSPRDYRRLVPATPPNLYLSGDANADKLLAKDPFALLIGMVLDQQVPLEWAFSGPLNLRARLGNVSVKTVVAMDEDALVAAFCAKPALHRYPAAMARRVYELSGHVATEYGGDPAKIWKTATSGEELLKRIKKLPGFGEQKAKIFVALLGKQFGVQPEGWRTASAPFGEEGTHLSVADIDSADSLSLVRDHKKAMKAARKAAAAAPGVVSAANKAPAKKASAAKKAPAKKAAAKKTPARKSAAAKSS